jgi:hypothetical protein
MLILAAYVWPGRADATTVFEDGTFDLSTWDSTLYSLGNGGSQTAIQQMSGGNPGAYLYVDNAVNAAPPYSGIWGVFLKKGAVYDPSLGAIESVSYSEDAILFSSSIDRGEGQASFLVLEQGGSIFSRLPYFPTNYDNWTHLESSGLLASDFGKLDLTTFDIDNAQNPDFSESGSALRFGFYRANSTPSRAYSRAGGIDNWQVVIESVATPVPEPSTLLLLATGVAGLGAATWRHRRE